MKGENKMEAIVRTYYEIKVNVISDGVELCKVLLFEYIPTNDQIIREFKSKLGIKIDRILIKQVNKLTLYMSGECFYRQASILKNEIVYRVGVVL